MEVKDELLKLVGKLRTPRRDAQCARYPGFLLLADMRAGNPLVFVVSAYKPEDC